MMTNGTKVSTLRRRGTATVLATALTLAAPTGSALAGETTRVSVDDAGSEANGESGIAALDQAGRTVAFASNATNLVAGEDANRRRFDVFVHDRRLGVTTRVDVASDGTQADGLSVQPHLSRNGRLVVFVSDATNLVAGDGNGTRDIFVHDRKSGVTERVSVASDGSEGNAPSLLAVLSGNGRFVAFQSAATNLVADDGNDESDVFVHDRRTGVTERVNVNDAGAATNGPSILALSAGLGANGRLVPFASDATNLVDGDDNGFADVFVRDRRARRTMRVSVAKDGGEADGASGEATMSENGRFVAFVSQATNLVEGDTNGSTDAFVRDLRTGVTRRVSVASDGSEADGSSASVTISSDGRFVAFYSAATNLVEGDTNEAEDVFVHDRKTGITTRASVASSGAQADARSGFARISGNGRAVAFESDATNLVGADMNGHRDVFVRDLK